MKKRIVSALVLAVLFCLLAAPAFAATYATVRGGWLRLRANPSYDAAIITSYKNGTVVTVLSVSNGWARVMTPDYRVGYMDSRYLAGGSPAPTVQPTVQPYPTRTWTDVNRIAYVTSTNGKGVRLRSAPYVNSSNVMGLYPVGRTVTELRRSNDGWSYIRIDGKYGYMMSQFLTTGFNPGPRPTVIPVPITATPAVPTATPTPVPTATPTPDMSITSVKLDPYQPTVGDTVKVIVSPAGAEYSCVWYSDDNRLLSTSTQYKVTAAEAGHVINVRITGAGASRGFVADATTGKVKPAPTDPPVVVESFVEPSSSGGLVLPPDSSTSTEGGVVSEWVDGLY